MVYFFKCSTSFLTLTFISCIFSAGGMAYSVARGTIGLEVLLITKVTRTLVTALAKHTEVKNAPQAIAESMEGFREEVENALEEISTTLGKCTFAC